MRRQRPPSFTRPSRLPSWCGVLCCAALLCMVEWCAVFWTAWQKRRAPGCRFLSALSKQCLLPPPLPRHCRPLARTRTRCEGTSPLRTTCTARTPRPAARCRRVWRGPGAASQLCAARPAAQPPARDLPGAGADGAAGHVGPGGRQQGAALLQLHQVSQGQLVCMLHQAGRQQAQCTPLWRRTAHVALCPCHAGCCTSCTR